MNQHTDGMSQRDRAPRPADRRHADRRRTLVFVVGYRRSGTTALQDQIAAHPDVHYLSGITRNEFHLFDLYERDRAEYAALVEAYTGRPPRFDVVADAEAVFAACPRPVGLVKSTRMLLSPATWGHFAHWAARTTHEVAVLGIIRFPLDAISSDIRRNSPDLPPERRVQPIIPDERVTRPETAQTVWCEAYRRALDEAGFADRSWLVRLEDIVADPTAACTSLGGWLGLATPLVAREWRPLHWGRWRTDPTFTGFCPSEDLVDLASRFGYRLPTAARARRAS